MSPTDVIVDKIIEKLKKNRIAKGARNNFGYVSEYSSGVIISRETGKNTKISKKNLAQAVEAVRQDSSIYSLGPSSLRPYIQGRIFSPLWALLRLLNLPEILS